ncbi:DUF2092 domain-containing protein [Sporocytophaga myxococcoides]|uniref:DUF2092 domain-containing protein n=1 Tax=Sporocytophaga myxococcoides TaxID=153721 RepID=UPI0006886E3E|nr:DUF2092 domain-containing protein [Sporocytophaga myxococcoides]
MAFNPKSVSNKVRWTLLLLVLSAISVGGLMAYVREPNRPVAHKSEKRSPSKGVVNKDAERILKSMSDYMNNLSEFSCKSNGYFEYIDDSTDQKIQMNNTSSTFVKRPNKIKVERKGDVADMEYFYDGKQITVFGKKLKYYAQADAPDNIDKAIDFGRDALNIETPGADLFYTNLQKGLMEDVISGIYVGKGWAGGKECHHLAFKGNETDWQIWVEDSPAPLPRKYVITSKKIEQSPDYSIEINEWNTSPKLSSDLFTFKAPKGAKKINFIKNNISEEAKSIR